MAVQVTNGRVSTNGEAPRAPAGVPIAGHILQWRADPVKLLTEAMRQGDVVRLALPGRTYFLSHPAHVKHVLQDNHQNYCKGWVFDRIKPVLGREPAHRRWRHLEAAAPTRPAVLQA